MKGRGRFLLFIILMNLIFQRDCLCLEPGSSTEWREAQGTLGTFLPPGVAGGERCVPLKVSGLTFFDNPKEYSFPFELF